MPYDPVLFQALVDIETNQPGPENEPRRSIERPLELVSLRVQTAWTRS